MSKLLRLLAALAAFSLLAAACGSSTETVADEAVADTEEADDTETEEADDTETDDSDDTEEASADVSITEMSWEEVQAQAQIEGEINWSHWYFQERLRPFVEAFTEETGIAVNISDGDFQANEDKLLAESDRDEGTVDVMSYTFLGMSQLDQEAFFMPLDQLPDFDSLTDELEGVDTDGRGILWWGNQTGIAYDTTNVAEEDLPQSFDELTAWIDANPNRFGLNDPSQGGASQSFIQSAVRSFTGSEGFFGDEADEASLETWEPAWEWFEGINDDIVITGNNADTLTRINDGELWMGAAWEDQLAGLQNTGEISENVGIYIPDWGMNGGGNSIVIPTNAANPAAALVFIDWMTSPETQASLNEVFGVAPQHPDAPADFALISADQRANTRRWFSAPYTDYANSTFIERIIGA